VLYFICCVVKFYIFILKRTNMKTLTVHVSEAPRVRHSQYGICWKYIPFQMHSNCPGVIFSDVSVHTSRSSVFVKFAFDVCSEKKVRGCYIRGWRRQWNKAILSLNKNLDNLHLEHLGLFSEMAALKHIIWKCTSFQV
jgi:hypothetical protein